MGKILEKINEQMNFELESGYIYLSMAAYLKDRGFDGMSDFMHKQAHEEYEHAMKMYGFLTSVGKLPVFESINKPAANYKSELDVFQQALQHEKKVTSRVNDLVDLAREENDKRVEIFLQWYVTEQVEEEDVFTDLVLKLERTDGKFNALYLLDGMIAGK